MIGLHGIPCIPTLQYTLDINRRGRSVAPAPRMRSHIFIKESTALAKFRRHRLDHSKPFAPARQLQRHLCG